MSATEDILKNLQKRIARIEQRQREMDFERNGDKRTRKKKEKKPFTKDDAHAHIAKKFERYHKRKAA